MSTKKEPTHPRDPSSAEEAIEVLIAERDALKKRAEKAVAKLSSMSEYSIELQRLIEALSGGHPVPDSTRAPMYRALAKCVKDERDALRKRAAELEAASMEADREIRGALVWRANALAALKAGLNALGMHGPCTNNSCPACARAARLMTEAKRALEAEPPAPKCRHGYLPSLCLADASCDGPTDLINK